uniref:Protein gp42 n=1 Tax=Anthurium amnicola TaxID=1678845 RepID=A0A1D1ZI46_9ARAE
MDPPARRPPGGILKGIHREAAGALGILREALRISAAGWRLSLPVTFSVLLPSSLLSLSQQLLFDPSSLPAPGQAGTLRRVAAASGWAAADGNIPVFADAGFLVAYWLLGFFQMTATVFGASAAYRDGHAGPGELLRKVRREWRGAVATQLCVAALRTGYWGLLDLISAAVIPVAAGPTGLLLTAVGGALYLLGDLLYYYLDVAWESSWAAAAADGCGGFRALGLAGEMTEGRRRVQGMVIALLYAGAADAASSLFELVLGLAMAGATHVALAVVFRGLLELMYMYKLTAVTVFYYKCRGSRWVEGAHYSRLPTAPP